LIPAPVRGWLGYAALLSFFINVLMLATPIYMLQIFDRVLVSHSLHTLGMLSIITVALIAAHAVLDVVRGRLLLRAGIAVEQVVGPRVLERIHQFDSSTGQPSGRAELMRDVSTLRNYLSGQHLISLFDSPWIVIFTLLIFGFSWVLGVITLIGMLVLLLLAAADEKITYRHYTEAQFASQRAAQFAHASVRNSEVVHALGMRETMIGLWGALTTNALAALRKASDRGTLLAGTTKAARILVQVAMLGVGAYLVVAENLPPGIMIVATIIVARAIGPVESAISGWRNFVEARNAYARVDRLLQMPLGEPERRDVALPPLRGAIMLERVSFAFANGVPVFRNVSIQLEPGEVLGLIGSSGSGKSTLARVIVGLMRPTQGKVILDGYDVDHYERASLGKQLGYLAQDPELFAGTVARNICRMQDPEQYSEEIVRLATLLQLAPAIARMPDGYDTRLAENGANLSGGQRQLVGLARALFGSPRVIVLDEPDANLDQQSEAQLLKVIDDFREKREATLIVITHNPRIVDKMDRLLLLEEGTAKQLARRSQPSPGGLAALVGGPRKGQGK
jgi:ATP-binding cassette, subfamily C, type I secretion system permease/ATPase